MRRIIITLIACTLLPIFLIGCGQGDAAQPDTLVVAQYEAGFMPSPSNPPPAYTDVPSQYVMQHWQNNDAALIQKLYADVVHAPIVSTVQGHNNYCYAYWYLITFQRGTTILAAVRLPSCQYEGFLSYSGKRIAIGDDFLHTLIVEMKIPINW